MKRNTKKLLISIIILAVFSTQLFSPSLAKASIDLHWNNPNKGNFSYKFHLKDYLNPKLIMSVVGCTNIVTNVSSAITGFMQASLDSILNLKTLKAKSLVEACTTLRDAVSIVGLSIPNLPIGNETLRSMCANIIVQKSTDTATTKAVQKVGKTLTAAQKELQCFNGIAITLAKNQLTAMTKATMNWITTGFSGDPMYVQNIDSFMQNISDKLVNKELDIFKDASGNYNINDYPYGRGYSVSVVDANETTNNIAGSLKQDLTSYLPQAPNTEEAIQKFSTNFDEGGWNGWLALTQHPQNNILGFSVKAAQATAREIQKKQGQQKAKLAQDNGFLSQQTCILYAIDKKRAATKTKALSNLSDAQEALVVAQKALAVATAKLKLLEEQNGDGNGIKGTVGEIIAAEGVKANAGINLVAAQDTVTKMQHAVKKAGVSAKNAKKKCSKYKVVTPGSIIKDKISTYINSPERQLELAKTINDSLNALFTAMINKFRLNGLTSLGSNDTAAFSKVSGGFGSNSLTTGGVVDNSGNPTNGNGFTIGRNFDLTKDLGNVYYNVPMTNLGDWNAKTNKPMLSISIGPYDSINKIYLSDVYYVVTTAGDTKLFTNGYNVWNVGDRAYFDGMNWQNWKKDTPNPIKKRGVLQIQQDYLVAAQELLKRLPGIMPEIGQLDYCLPGPNPNWLANSSNPIKAFTDFISALNTTYTHKGILVRDYITINSPSGDVYNTFRNVFNGTNLWPKVIETAPYQQMQYLASSATSPNKGGRWKGKPNRAEANDSVSSLKNKIIRRYGTFITKYTAKMDVLYGVNSPMQKQFLQNEATPILRPNPAFIPMSSAGFKVTSNILAYNKGVTDTAQKYKSSIAQTNLNLYKLKRIASQVGKIIKAAQARRDQKLAALEIANTNIPIQAGEEINSGDQLYSSRTNIDGSLVVMKYTPDLASSGITPIGTANGIINTDQSGKMTGGSINNWAIPVSCKKEEDLSSLTSNEILVDFGGSKENRCNDGIDNDLDGLVDAQDPDCSGYYADKNGPSKMNPGICTPINTNPPASDKTACKKIVDKNTCLAYPETPAGGETICKWVDNIPGLNGKNGNEVGHSNGGGV